MTILKTKEFEKSLLNLPREIQDLYYIQEERFLTDPRDPRLHVKKVRELTGVLSFRTTRRYRAFFYIKNTYTAVFFEIDHRKDIYR